jgi:IS30 family transposase
MTEIKNPTFYNLFKDIEKIEDKIDKFLDVARDSGWSYRRIAKALGIHHRTVKAILDEIKTTDQYKAFMAENDEAIQEFSDPKYRMQLFDEFEADTKRLERLIQAELDKEKRDIATLNLYMRIKTSLMAQKLRASVLLKALDSPSVKAQVQDRRYDRIRDEALKEFGDKVVQ